MVVHVISVRLLALLLNPQDETAKSDNFNLIFGIVAKPRLNIAETFGCVNENAYLCGVIIDIRRFIVSGWISSVRSAIFSRYWTCSFHGSLRNAALSAFEEGTYNKKWPTLVTKIGQLR